jgi:hypothetical protein
MGAYRDLSWPGRAADHWGHWGSRVLIASVLCAIALGVRPLPATSPLAAILPVALIALVLLSWRRMREHDRRLCELCVKSMPLEVAEIAARMHFRFTLAHLGERRKIVVSYLAILVASNGLLLIGPIGRLSWGVIQLSMIYLVLAYSSHRRFQPWCPQCQGGEPKRLVNT